MANGKTPPALRLTPEAAPAEPQNNEGDVAAPDETGGGGAGTITLTGPDRAAFTAAAGHECKVGDKYTVELTVTDASPDSITFTLDDVEAEYGEGEGEGEPAEGEAGGAAAGAEGLGAGMASKTPAMTYA